MKINPYKNNIEPLRRQDIKKLFHYDGSLYISKVKEFILNKTNYHEKTMANQMPKRKSIYLHDSHYF